jgi:hypothetical protein
VCIQCAWMESCRDCREGARRDITGRALIWLRLSVCPFDRLFVFSFVRLFVCSFVRLFAYSLIRLFVYSFVRSLRQFSDQRFIGIRLSRVLPFHDFARSFTNRSAFNITNVLPTSYAKLAYGRTAVAFCNKKI